MVVVPLLGPDAESFQHPAVAVLLVRHARQLRGLGDEDVLVAEPQHAVDVASGEGIEGVAHDLHVLLRHRLLRQPGGFEGLALLVELLVAGRSFRRGSCTPA